MSLVAFVVVGEVVGVMLAVTLAAADASVGWNTAAFGFHFIFTLGGLVGALLLIPLTRFLFPLGERESVIVSQRAPFSAVAASIRSSIVWCGGASIHRSPFLPSSS